MQLCFCLKSRPNIDPVYKISVKREPDKILLLQPSLLPGQYNLGKCSEIKWSECNGDVNQESVHLCVVISRPFFLHLCRDWWCHVQSSQLYLRDLFPCVTAKLSGENPSLCLRDNYSHVRWYFPFLIRRVQEKHVLMVCPFQPVLCFHWFLSWFHLANQQKWKIPTFFIWISNLMNTEWRLLTTPLITQLLH